ncbi:MULTISPECIES: pyridoxal phosphate-dependent aminotransferase [Myxococcus]|uniref:Pyridoxal phosphate-dependent aminotransferase n=1 Tax=Myxococcus llanfairpwllgwyngyllgogerychwyrndrobwllllantysiliogogogochensis TaxID=2590453 RepID=A0A540X7P8_9BACT|nr:MULTISPECIES: pyridoxal phosphate-dependent aminotransferase [Myxococcus]NTX04738.1 pyridoxal phosphate-dependent aminotransferase [Myxococcus sp. CA040A]NTX15080.1 pyridoxal phosphate-dependent aminotransferase [Myxococcus sp. CA056]NTX55165.1 pyridoxal phosphate-dependent aminotransferase [Myxococcus sp. CA039A]TQF16704.1 pyridoxal phosphate-dependent aminotransferase [Myxococcus llanfairpwllgwyngyllgogerychwyrndrobwllllantysiliogogogochensis]
MEPLRSFFMEDYLEGSRFTARYNLGESGGRPVTVGELLTGSGVSAAQASEVFLSTLLRDSPNWGRADLRDLVAAMHPGATRDNVLITTGTSEALLLLFRQLRPRKVALAWPAFQLLYELPMQQGAQWVKLPVRWNAQGQPSIDAAEWLECLERERPDAVIINTPHNPSGLVLDADLLGAVTAWAEAHGATVVGDEHYRFLSSEDAVLGPTVWRPGTRSFVTGSFIKCLGCPGLRIGWCVGDTKMLALMQNEKNYTTHTVNPVTEWISYEVLKDLHSPALHRAREDWLQNRRTLAAFLERSRGVYGTAPQGGLVTCIGVRDAMEPAAFSARLEALAAAGVFVLPLSAMEVGEPHGAHPLERGHGFRLGLGAAPAHFAEALEVIERATAR